MSRQLPGDIFLRATHDISEVLMLLRDNVLPLVDDGLVKASTLKTLQRFADKCIAWECKSSQNRVRSPT